jgi:hypothetical protein
MDGRLNRWLRRFLAGHGQLFTPSLAGGGLAFLLDDQRDLALLQIKAALLIRPDAKNVHVRVHIDCGAYWLLAKRSFSNLEEEIAAKWDDLRTIEALLQREFPQIITDMGLIDLDGSDIPQPHIARRR